MADREAKTTLIGQINSAYNAVRELEYTTDDFVSEGMSEDTMALILAMLAFERTAAVTLQGFKATLTQCDE